MAMMPKSGKMKRLETKRTHILVSRLGTKRRNDSLVGLPSGIENQVVNMFQRWTPKKLKS